MHTPKSFKPYQPPLNIFCKLDTSTVELGTFAQSAAETEDTGASVTVTNSKSDFTSDQYPVQPTKLQGIASGLEVKGIGDAKYSFKTDNHELSKSS
jgi:hypothetical protein